MSIAVSVPSRLAPSLTVISMPCLVRLVMNSIARS